MTRRLIGFGIIVLTLIAACLGWLWVKSARGFSASAQPTALEAKLATMARTMAIPRDSAAMVDPLPASPENLVMASKHFAAHCAVCHDNNGDGRTNIGNDLYPKPPDMRFGSQSMSDGALFYSIRNGIRMSGMPAWPDDEDNKLWMLVQFIRHLPHQTPAEVEEMKKYNPKTIFPEPIL